MDTETKPKGKTVNIGGIEIAEPMRHPPTVGSVCFIVNTAGAKPLEMVWNNEESDHYLLAGGMIHAKKADAARYMLAIRNMCAVSYTVDSYLDGLQHEQ